MVSAHTYQVSASEPREVDISNRARKICVTSTSKQALKRSTKGRLVKGYKIGNYRNKIN